MQPRVLDKLFELNVGNERVSMSVKFPQIMKENAIIYTFSMHKVVFIIFISYICSIHSGCKSTLWLPREKFIDILVDFLF